MAFMHPRPEDDEDRFPWPELMMALTIIGLVLMYSL